VSVRPHHGPDGPPSPNGSRFRRDAPPRQAPATRAVHAGLPAPAQGEPFLPGPTFAGPYHLAGDADSHRYGYQRYGNPTWTLYEAALADLEGGEAVIFPSGMTAVTAVLLEMVSPGDVLVAPSDAYPGVRDVAAAHLAPAGVEIRLVPTDDVAIREALDGATLVWVELPSNPALDVLDLEALAADVRAAGALLAVDNTLATPLAQRPIELGADISMSSATKALTGHSDLILGHAACRDPHHAEMLRAFRSRVGAIPGPFEVWLAHRSLATLDVRLERQCANALALAEALAADDRVSGVRYPGLPDHPGHEIAARQMGGRFGSIVGFELADADTAHRFLAACELVAEATSFGGTHTTAERRARWGTDAVSEGFVRLAAGLEDPRDLIADVVRALDAVAPR
jgi:cystathionine gamma-lyase